jgi:hypothetical protein
MKEHEKIEGTVENWESGKLGNDERFAELAPNSEQWTKKDREKFKSDNQLDNVKIDRDGIVSLDLSKSSVRKKVSEQAKRFSVIKTKPKGNK